MAPTPTIAARAWEWSLLAENLALIDAESMPAYLESSNPENDRRYERLGFAKVGRVPAPRRAADLLDDVAKTTLILGWPYSVSLERRPSGAPSIPERQEAGCR